MTLLVRSGSVIAWRNSGAMLSAASYAGSAGLCTDAQRFSAETEGITMQFSSLVSDQWIPASAGDLLESGVLVAVDPSLTENRSVSLLRVQDGPTILQLSPARASELGQADGSRIDGSGLPGLLGAADVALHDPDHIFYLTLDAQTTLGGETAARGTRQLTTDDSAAFDRLTAEAPDDDLEDAFVEFDHWLVFGTFVEGRLVSVASMYPWSGTQLADIGVITLPDFRGRGLGRATVRAISAAAIVKGYEPQYRCQLDNAASVALARAAGFTLFGEWEVIDADD